MENESRINDLHAEFKELKEDYITLSANAFTIFVDGVGRLFQGNEETFKEDIATLATEYGETMYSFLVTSRMMDRVVYQHENLLSESLRTSDNSEESSQDS